LEKTLTDALFDLLLQQDSNTRVSLPYEDIFESASNLLHFPNAASTSGTNAPETPRTRSRRIKAEDDAQMRGDNQAEEEGAAALLAEDMRRFGELQVTKKTMDMICQVQRELYHWPWCNVLPSLTVFVNRSRALHCRYHARFVNV
jgi:hypothetical protein